MTTMPAPFIIITREQRLQGYERSDVCPHCHEGQLIIRVEYDVLQVNKDGTLTARNPELVELERQMRRSKGEQA